MFFRLAEFAALVAQRALQIRQNRVNDCPSLLGIIFLSLFRSNLIFFVPLQSPKGAIYESIRTKYSDFQPCSNPFRSNNFSVG